MDDVFKLAKALALLSGLGIYFAIIIGICIFLGIQIDEYFYLNGKGKLIGILIGFPIAIYSTYRQLKANYSNKD